MTFENILDYERKCAGFGYSTRRGNFHLNGKAYIISIPRHKSGIETWQLFTADGTPTGAEGFIDKNYPASLAALGYFQDGKTATGYLENFPICILTASALLQNTKKVCPFGFLHPPHHLQQGRRKVFCPCYRAAQR